MAKRHCYTVLSCSFFYHESYRHESCLEGMECGEVNDS